MGCTVIDVEPVERRDGIAEVDLLTRVRAVSQETMAIVENLPAVDVLDNQNGASADDA